MNLYKLAELFDRNGDLLKRWYVGYSYIHPETKKYKLFQVFISTKLHTKHARRVKANEIIENINNKLLQGYNPFQNENIGYTTVINAVNKIIESKATYIRKRSISSYRSIVTIFNLWLQKENLTNLAIECFNFQHATKFSDFIKIDRKLSNSTHNNYIKCLRTLFYELVLREYLLKNPFEKVKALPEEERSIFAYNSSELKKLKDYCIIHDSRLWLVCEFIFYCAVRPAEIVQLKIRYIDVRNGKLNIPSNVSKNKKQSIVSMPPAFIEDLSKLNLNEIDQDFYLFSKNLLPGSFLIAPTRLAERFKTIADKIGIKRRLYDLKHTGAGLAIKNGANIKDLQLHLRHSDIKITDEYLKAFSSEVSKDFMRNYPVL